MPYKYTGVSGDDRYYQSYENLRSQASTDTLRSQGAQWSTANVAQCPIPQRLLQHVPQLRYNPGEFTTLRYSAANVDPRDFTRRFRLRQQEPKRNIELLIVITMYNEEEYLFARTIAAVFTNIKYLCEDEKARKKYPGLWGDKDSWQKVVVCVVCDGKSKLNPKTKSLLEAMGCYQAAVEISGSQAHIYEHTTHVQVSLDGEKVLTAPGKLEYPAQMILCIKEKNTQKINSHRWAFQAIGRSLEPNVVVLIDAGTKPYRNSIYELWKSFDLNPQSAGACGEIIAGIGKFGKGLLNPLVASQNFEYKMSNILEKPLESVFGFISVLPGAFSAYRFKFLDADGDGVGPLYKYFKGEDIHNNLEENLKTNISKKNMYLAEDRILCFELVMKRSRKHILQYVMSARAETDVPDSTAGFIKQRRRWLNGSFFASVYALAHVKSIFTSGHSAWRKMAFLLEFIYQLISLLFSWFSLANFYLVFRILATSLGDPSLEFKPGKWLGLLFEWLYFGVWFLSFVLSIGNKPDRSRKMYIGIMVFWAVIMVYIIFAAIYISVKTVNREKAADPDGVITGGDIFANHIFRDLILSLGSTYALYFLSSLMFLQPGHMLHSLLQYILISPSYINVLNVYAFCNIHDLGWGTRGGEGDCQCKKEKKVQDLPKVSSASCDENYSRAIEILEGKQVEPESPPTEAGKQRKKKEDMEAEYLDTRCWMLLAWCSTNFALGATILNSGGLNRMVATQREIVASTRSSIYLTVVLWSVTALSAFRFLGATWFLILRIFRGV